MARMSNPHARRLFFILVALSLTACGKGDGDRRAAPKASATKSVDDKAGGEASGVKSTDSTTAPQPSTGGGKPTDQPVESPSAPPEAPPAPPREDPLLGGGEPLKPGKKGSKVTALGDKGGEGFAGDNNDPFGGTLDGGGSSNDVPKPKAEAPSNSRARKGAGTGLKLGEGGRGAGAPKRAPASDSETAGIPRDEGLKPDIQAIGKPAVEGGMDSALIRRTQRRYLGQLAACYRARLKVRGAQLQGTMTLDYGIIGSGRVSHVSVKVSDALEDATLKACIASRIKRWQFPEPKAEQATVKQKYRLQVKK